MAASFAASPARAAGFGDVVVNPSFPMAGVSASVPQGGQVGSTFGQYVCVVGDTEH